MAQVRESSDRIDLLLHAAGVEVSRALPDKEPREFDLVHGVKADGWFNVMKAAGDLPIGATVVFSSVAGRFGNAGQCDYGAANDLLCKITSSLRRTRPDTRALAVDWTAWGGIGMATRGSMPEIMEMAGVRDAATRGRRRLDQARAHRTRLPRRGRGRRRARATGGRLPPDGRSRAGDPRRRGAATSPVRWSRRTCWTGSSCGPRWTRRPSRSWTTTASTGPPCSPASWGWSSSPRSPRC